MPLNNSYKQTALKRIEDAYQQHATELDLSSLELGSIPPEIGKLTELCALNLSNTRLNYFPLEITPLVNLTSLDLSKNFIKAIPPEIERLSDLRSLDISLHAFVPLGGGFLSLPAEIGNLVNLTSLSLHFAGFTSFPTQISKLKNLESLDLSGSNLTELPAEIGKLENLQKLDLSDNQLSNLPADFENLTKLVHLNLSHNRFAIFPIELTRLTQISHLNISLNQLTSVPSDIWLLENLRNLDLAYNSLNELPLETILLGRHLEKIDLRGNKLEIAPEIIEKTDNPQAILSYYEATVYSSKLSFLSFKDVTRPIPEVAKLIKKIGNARSLDEAKILIIGQPEVGKTSIVEQILHHTFNRNQIKTEGISIAQWQIMGEWDLGAQNSMILDGQHFTFNNPSRFHNIRINIWDFGGQEIMHATHQFFLTKRSLYLLVLDARLTEEENRVEYWLKVIQSFGGDSPVLIVGNKIDQHPLDIDRTGLQKKYPNMVGILETSAATGAGIEELKATISGQVSKLPHVRDLLPETWFKVKTKLEELGRESNFITYDKYLELCVESEISDETGQRTLIGFLHDLGVILHFQDDPRLEPLGILSPQWVTNGVYKILNSHTLFQNKGVLTVPMLDEILNPPEYPRGKRLFIVDMMKKFELCYDLEADKTFLVPDLLPKDEPKLDFNGIPAFEYVYPVLPSSVITRLIVRMNQHIRDNCVWRTGVLLKIGNNRALVKADNEDRKISIAIDGLEHTRRDALSAIRYQLDEIHASIKGLDAQKRVPIPNAPNAEPLEYEYLLMLEREGQETHFVKDGTRLVKITVREVLSGIESETQRRETGGNVTNIYIGGNFDGNLTVGDGNQSIKDSYNKITAAGIDAELKETLKQLADAVAVMAKSLPTAQAAEATEELSKLVEEATKPQPNKKWYSVSIDGLIKAAENVEKVGEPVINLSRKVLSLLTGGMIK